VLLTQKEADVGESLKDCRLLNKKIAGNCYQGVFMENIQRENLSEHGVADREEWTPEYLEEQKKQCNNFGGQEQIECWRSLGPAILTALSYEIEPAVRFCQSSPEAVSGRVCVREVAGGGMVDKLSGGRSGLSDLCRFIVQEQDYKNCVEDLAGYVLLTSVSYKNKMREFCGLVRDEAKIVCQEKLKDF
jgi:hypothetical protein